MRKKINKLLAVCMAFGVLASSTFTAMLQNTAIQKAAAKENTKIEETKTESQKAESKKDFLVQTQNQAERKEVISVLKESIDNVSDTASILKNENILMADLSAKQINELNQKHDVIIERDRMIEGSAQDEVTKSERKAIENMVKKQWSRKAVGAETVVTPPAETNPQKSGKENVRVAILDSGLDETSDVNLAGSISFTPDDSVKDITGHGTMVTNIIASNHNGICKSGIIPADSPIEIYSVRVLDEKNEAPVSRVLEALQWCMENDINIIHMSFGMNTDSEILHSIIRKAEKAGILMIAAVGNNGEKDNNKVQYPAAYEEVIGVGSVNEDMEHSAFSATGKEVELVAPGENVPVSSYWEQNGVGSGTSYAAPHVTAVAAMLWAKETGKSAAFIRRLLCESAKQLGDSDKYGNGLVDYEYASKIFKSFSPATKEVNENTTKAKSYEVDECLKASWEYEGHKSLIHTTDKLSSEEIEVVRYTSYYADRSKIMKTYDVLHARGNSNYVAAAKCLYRASRVWKAGAAKKTVYALANDYASSKSGDALKDEKAHLKSAMEKAVTYDFQDINGKKATVREGRLQLLGLAIHVAGDAYAHKVQCLNTEKGRQRITEIYNKYKSKIKPQLKDGESSIKEMKNAIKKGLITSQMKRYFKDNQAAGTVCNKYYTDSTTYMEKRYSVGAKTATNKLLSYFGNGKAFKEYVFCPYESDKSYSYKLRYLVPFLKDAGFDLSDSNYTEKKWEELSCS